MFMGKYFLIIILIFSLIFNILLFLKNNELKISSNPIPLFGDYYNIKSVTVSGYLKVKNKYYQNNVFKQHWTIFATESSNTNLCTIIDVWDWNSTQYTLSSPEFCNIKYINAKEKKAVIKYKDSVININENTTNIIFNNEIENGGMSLVDGSNFND